MPKRNRNYDDMNTLSIYAAPPLESTMLLDTGGIISQNSSIGDISEIRVNASVSSGTRLFQYNRFFWNKDLYSFTFDNGCIFLIISYYNSDPAVVGADNDPYLYTCWYPIFVPLTTMTRFQSIGNDPTVDPTERIRIIDDMLYYLNGAFTGNGEPGVNPVTYPPNGPLHLAPAVFSYKTKGWFLNTVANQFWPIFSNDDIGPPLIFIKTDVFGPIALVRNPEYWNRTTQQTYHDIAFQMVTPLPQWTNSPGNPNNEVTTVGVGTTLTQIFPFSFEVPGSFQNEGQSYAKGWCGRGVFHLGFKVNQSLDDGLYTDVYEANYNDPALQDLWVNYSNFPNLLDNRSLNGSSFSNFALSHKLEKYILIGGFLPQFLASRFITISSSVLTRDQKLSPISNNPTLQQPNIMAIEYMTLSSTRTWRDETLSGMSATNMNNPSAGRTNGYNDSPVVHMNPMYSIQTVDINIQTEWGTTVQNYKLGENAFVLSFFPTYNTGPTYPLWNGMGMQWTGDMICSYISGQNSFVISDPTIGDTSGTFPIPVWLEALNTNNPLDVAQPIVAFFATYNAQPLYMLFSKNVSNYQPLGTTTTPPAFSPNMPYSGNMVHFGRVLGY